MLPTLLAAAGDTSVKADLLKGTAIGKTTYKVHLDGYDLRPGAARARPSGRAGSSSTGPTTAASRRCATTTGRSRSSSSTPKACKVWQEPFTELRAPKITNLRMDPFERAEHENAMGYQRWYMDRMFLIAPAGAYVGQWLQSFKEFPPRQKPGSFNLDRVMEAVTAGSKQ